MSSSMASQTLDEIRNRERLNEFKIAFKISAIQLIGPLFPFFSIADFYSYYEHFKLFFILRLSVTLFCAVFYIMVRSSSSLVKIKYQSIVLILYPSAMINLMILISNDLGSVYFAGLNLIAAGAICFFPWKDYKEVAVVTTTIFLPYLALPFFIDSNEQMLIKYFVNWFFVAGTVLISYAIRYIYEKLKYNEVNVREELRREIESRNLVIQEKSAAAVRLSSLSKQFSPQVVQAIDSGDLDISNSLKRAHICGIFIDIVNSTDRVVRIDKDDLNKALSMFMSDAMSVLLKYDITIDKFLGDGVLAFSNAPIEQKDYIKRVVDAAIEIKAKIIENREQYIECWKNEMEIKIGVAAGYANVGFYGSADHFRSYTAIGSVINLASRLCSIANPNSILVSHDVYKIIMDSDNYKIVDLGMRKIKGFEGDIIKVYDVQSANELVNSNVPYCPSGHGILSLDVNEQGIYEFKCRSCDHILQEPPKTLKKAA